MALLSPTEVAKRYGFSPSQIRRLIRNGTIKAEQVGAFYAVDEKDIKDLKRQRAVNKVKKITD